ncbi:MAG TPA: UDP-N-acetylglucosamine 1-carboxyvinyltransferase [Firmicutes bacterium]|nr:UDP-N-acetylglucosamine 1-carboxyvinyltransferase [Candidatus Fermentithermobacillaceae bacterium]
MSLVIKGGKPLRGTVRCDGAKNAALPIMAGAILSEDISIIDNVPHLRDVETMSNVLRSIGVSVRVTGNSVLINPGKRLRNEAPYDLVRMMRASFLIMGPLLVRLGVASVPLPGGCAIGQRPVDLHLKGFQAMGAQISVEGGFVRARAEKLRGAEIYLDIPSVGATENIMMAAVGAEGVTVIENAAQEPEIVDLANFLNSMGAEVTGAGTSRIKVEGVKKLSGTRYNIIPDRIEASTFLIAGAITRGKVMVENVIPTHIRSVLAKLKESGAYLLEGSRSVEIEMPERPTPVNIKTLPYPGFPTDVQAPFMSLLAIGQGTSLISETVFENRFNHAEELIRMGAKIKIEDSNAIVEGVPKLSGASLQATDLRAGACLALAALAAEGQSEIFGTEHIYRGYSDFATKLRLLGADIEEIGIPKVAYSER